MMALGVFQRATADQLWRMLRPGNRHDRLTRDVLNDLKRHGMVRVETVLPDNRKLWVLAERGHKEARALLPKDVRLSALRRKVELDAEGRPKGGVGFAAHTVAVTSTAAALTAAGFGTLLSWRTEAAHHLPHGFTLYTDLVMRAPDAGVPVMLIEVDRITESVEDLVAKLRRYQQWFELPVPTPKAAPATARKARRARTAARRGGAEAHEARMWCRFYPATGREGYPPVAFVFACKTPAQRQSRMARLEEAGWEHFAGRYYPGRDEGITAVDYHQAVPVVVTELERLTGHGAGGPVWRRLGRAQWQTLADALDNPGGDRLHTVQRERADRRRAEREAAEREARRPVCTRCGTRFTDARWDSVRRDTRQNNRSLCERCLRAHYANERAERAAQQAAREADAQAAAEAAARAARGVFGRRRRRR